MYLFILKNYTFFFFLTKINLYKMLQFVGSYLVFVCEFWHSWKLFSIHALNLLITFLSNLINLFNAIHTLSQLVLNRKRFLFCYFQIRFITKGRCHPGFKWASRQEENISVTNIWNWICLPISRWPLAKIEGSQNMWSNNGSGTFSHAGVIKLPSVTNNTGNIS